MIFFKKIRWKNFLSTGQHFTEIDLNRTNSTLIIGDNGAGKSTILDALSFALYGKPFRKITKGQLLNSINSKAAVVELEFTIGKHEYKVVRGIKPNVFEVWQNGKMINQDAAARDYQEMLERQILKLNHKSFSQIIVLGSATFTPFMQLSAANRREVIEDILDIGIFSVMNSLLKEKIQTNRDELQEAKYQVDLCEQKIELATNHRDELAKLRSAEIEKLNGKIGEHNDTITNATSEIKSQMEKVTELQEAISDQASVDKKIKSIEKLRTQLNDRYRSLANDIQFYEEHDNCPTCKQGIDEHFKHDTIQSKKEKREELENATVQLDEQYVEVSERLGVIRDSLNTISQLNTEIALKNAEIETAKRSITQIQQEIKDAETAEKDNETDQIADLEAELAKLHTSYEELAKDREVLGQASNILRDSGIKARIIKQYIPVINKLINKYLAAMDFFVQFELDENFNETIRSRYRDAFSYASFSEGEKMRIDLALLFTWRAIAKLRNSVSTNLLIMDEVFDSSLDAGGTEEFMKIMESLTHDTNVFVISHKGDQLFDKFHSVIKFEKHQNFSRIAA